METLNSKLKTQNKFQTQSTKKKTDWNLEFGIWSLFWILSLGFWICPMAWAKEAPRIEIRVEEKQEPSFDSTTQAQVIRPDQMPGAATSLPKLLERVAGVQIKRYGDLDDFAQVSIRGSTTDQVLIYLDGVLLNTARGGSLDLSLIPLDQVEKIEVYRGGSPGKIVDSTPGGVVYIHTKAKPEKTENILRNAVGSYYTYRGHVQRSEAFDLPEGRNFFYHASFNHFRSRGDFSFLDDRGTRANQADDRIVNRQNNDFQTYDGTFIFGAGKKNLPSWKIYENFYFKDEGIPGLGTLTSLNARLKTLRHLIHASLKSPQGAWEKTNWEGDLFLDAQKSFFQDPLGEIGVGTQDNEDTTVRFGPEFHRSWFLKNQVISGFAAHRGEFFSPVDKLAVTPNGPLSQRHMASLGAEDEISLLDEKFLLDPSARLQIFVNKLSGGSQITDAQVSSKLGVKFRPFAFLTLKTNLFRGFRQPTFGELFGDRGTLVGNPALAPEESLNFDIGAALQWKEISFFNDLFFEAVFFRHSAQNLIQFLQTSQFTAKAQNLDTALVQGSELSFAARAWEHFQLKSHYVYQAAKDDSNISPTRGRFLPGRPKHQLFLETEYVHRILRPFAELNFIGANFLDSQNLLKVNHRTLVALGLDVDCSRSVKLSFLMKNLLNQRIGDIAGFPLPGRSYWGEILIKL